MRTRALSPEGGKPSKVTGVTTGRGGAGGDRGCHLIARLSLKLVVHHPRTLLREILLSDHLRLRLGREKSSGWCPWCPRQLLVWHGNFAYHGRFCCETMQCTGAAEDRGNEWKNLQTAGRRVA